MIAYAPDDHPVLEFFRGSAGKVIDQELYDNSVSMYHIPDVGRFLKVITPELHRRAAEAGASLPLELGLSVGDQRWMIHIEPKQSRIEHDKLSRSLFDAELVDARPPPDGARRDRRGLRGRWLRGVHQHRHRGRPDAVRASVDLAQPAR